MHLFKKFCVYPLGPSYCYPFQQQYMLQEQFRQSQYLYQRQTLRQVPAQPTMPLFDNRPTPQSRG